MPDFLTPEEKAAIAAFPKENVRWCHRGESGIPLFGFSRRDAQKVAVARSLRNKAFQKSKDTDAVIRIMWKSGLTDREISPKVNLKPKSVYQRRYRMGLI